MSEKKKMLRQPMHDANHNPDCEQKKAKDIIEYMESLYDEEQRRGLMRFFKTAPGE